MGLGLGFGFGFGFGLGLGLGLAPVGSSASEALECALEPKLADRSVSTDAVAPASDELAWPSGRATAPAASPPVEARCTR